MVADSVWIKVEAAKMGAACEEALAKLASGESEIVLDLGAIRRVDPAAVRALEKLAAAAEEKSAKVALLGVDVDVYKVLKLVRLSGRFAFL